MHTLLQTRSSLISMKREIKQAVCQVSDNSDKLCFHVGQLWCLVIDDCELYNNRDFAVLRINVYSILGHLWPNVISNTQRGGNFIK